MVLLLRTVAAVLSEAMHFHHRYDEQKAGVRLPSFTPLSFSVLDQRDPPECKGVQE